MLLVSASVAAPLSICILKNLNTGEQGAAAGACPDRRYLTHLVTEDGGHEHHAPSTWQCHIVVLLVCLARNATWWRDYDSRSKHRLHTIWLSRCLHMRLHHTDGLHLLIPNGQRWVRLSVSPSPGQQSVHEWHIECGHGQHATCSAPLCSVCAMAVVAAVAAASSWQWVCLSPSLLHCCCPLGSQIPLLLGPLHLWANDL